MKLSISLPHKTTATSPQKPAFRLFLLEDAKLFIENLPDSVAEKIRYNLHRVVGGEQNSDLFKKLNKTPIWEFRTLYNKTAYRLFAFWDKSEEALVIATHGIVKKTQKTPKKDIAKAEAMMKRYFENKNR